MVLSYPRSITVFLSVTWSSRPSCSLLIKMDKYFISKAYAKSGTVHPIWFRSTEIAYYQDLLTFSDYLCTPGKSWLWTRWFTRMNISVYQFFSELVVTWRREANFLIYIQGNNSLIVLNTEVKDAWTIVMVEKYERIICNHNNNSVLLNNSEENSRMTVFLDTCAHSAKIRLTQFSF